MRAKNDIRIRESRGPTRSPLSRSTSALTSMEVPRSFDSSSSVEVEVEVDVVDDDCRYTATMRLQLANEDMPFPLGPESCSPFLNAMRTIMSLYEVRVHSTRKEESSE